MQKVNTLQVLVKTSAIAGIAFFWVSFKIVSLKMAWHIISYSPEDEKTLRAPFKSRVWNSHDDGAVFKAVCGNCQEYYDDDEYHLIHGTHLCEACRQNQLK